MILNTILTVSLVLLLGFIFYLIWTILNSNQKQSKNYNTVYDYTSHHLSPKKSDSPAHLNNLKTQLNQDSSTNTLIDSYYNDGLSSDILKAIKYLSIKHIGNDEFEFSIKKVKTSVVLIPYPGVSSRYLALPINNSISSSDFKDKLQGIYKINDFNIYEDWKRSYKIEIQNPAIISENYNSIDCDSKGILKALKNL